MNSKDKMNEKQLRAIESLMEEARKFNTRNEFKHGNSRAYDRAQKLKLLDIVCKHMPPQHISWTKEKLHAEALQYNYRGEFQKGSPKAYDRALKLKILDEICSLMQDKHDKWTDDRIIQETRKYSNRVEFRKNNPYAHRLACEKGFIEMIPKQRRTWTEESVASEALKYTNRNMFRKGSSSAYNAARRMGILDMVCAHMVKVGSEYSRAIYMILFTECNSFYVGLSCNVKRRVQEHLVDSSNRHLRIMMTRNEPYVVQVLTEYLNIYTACKKEGIYQQKYISKGLTCLNIMPTGGIGGNTLKWTRLKIMKEAMKYSTRTRFIKGSSGAYDAALRRGIIDEVCEHMMVIQTQRNDDQIRSIALQYSSVFDFLKNDRKVYVAAYRRGIHGDVCCHMRYRRRPRYSDKELLILANVCSTKRQFHEMSPGAYSAAHKRGIMNKIWKESRPDLERYR